MKYVASREEMQQIDSYSINSVGIPGIVLMEKAALAMEEVFLKRVPRDSAVLIVTEKGNNGGDGLALGRLLLEEGYEVDFYEIGVIHHDSESYRIQKNILEQMETKFLKKFPEDEYDVVVDAVFGVGLKREVAGRHKDVIEKMNQMDGLKIAVDVPSGVDASTGQICGIGFQADITVTFGLSKVGLLLHPGADYSGEVIVKEIGFPKQAVREVSPKMISYTKKDLNLLPKRTAWSNKGSYGKVLLIAGSKDMAGAAILAARAAYRSGSGLVRLFSCEENRVILQEKVPEAILTTYSSEKEAFDLLPECLSWASVIGIGPGIGTGSFSRRLIKKVLELGKEPLVVDADGLNCLSILLSGESGDQECRNLFAQYEGGMILTPHLKEMSRLTGKTVQEIRGNLPAAAAGLGDKGHIVVLKDARTIVTDGSDPAYINMSGNNGMAVGGSGDVLTGIICGFIAGGLDMLTAARLGVYCHGLAGDAAVLEKGYYGLMAGDLPEYLCRILAKKTAGR